MPKVQYLEMSADISECGLYRYDLFRRFAPGPTVCWNLVNPSDADDVDDDPTVRKVQGFTERMGGGAFHIVNEFAFRTPKPKILKAAHRSGVDIVGPRNDNAIVAAAKGASIIIAAWGANGDFLNRDQETVRLLQKYGELHVLKLTKHGHPRHPLMLGYAHKPKRWRPTWSAHWKGPVDG